jgi:hypothetical protein
MQVIKKNPNTNSAYQYVFGDWKIRKRLDGLNNTTLIWVGVKSVANKNHRKSFQIIEELSLHQLRKSITQKEETK